MFTPAHTMIKPAHTMIDSAHSRRRRVARMLLAGALAAGAVVWLTPMPASAHVRVNADSTTAGTFSALTFRVPNESDTARTTEISVELPQSSPFLYVSTKPVPGWRASTTTATLPRPIDSEGTTITKAVRTITWTANSEAAAIAPGQYQEFSASVGPLPSAGTILLPATQTYSDGKIVSWDEATRDGVEPEHPAPELVITAASGSATPVASTPASAPASTNTGTSTDTTARALGGAGLAVGLIGLVVGLLGLRARRGAVQ